MTRTVPRWGCFLPDLTRLASGSSTTNLPARISFKGLPIARRRAKNAARPFAHPRAPGTE